MAGGLPTTPPFVLPYKRFATPCLLSRATDYLQRPRFTYRQAVRHARCLIGYPQPSAPAAEDSASAHQAVVDHSLIWRFVGWLGSLTLALDKAREMVLQQNPDSTCHRQTGSVDPDKARTPQRQQTLETAQQLLLMIPEWEACFGRELFPRFATRSGFD